MNILKKVTIYTNNTLNKSCNTKNNGNQMEEEFLW